MLKIYELLIEVVKQTNSRIRFSNQRRVEIARMFDEARRLGRASNELQELVRQFYGVDVNKNVLLWVAKHDNQTLALQFVTTYPRLIDVVDGKLCIRGGTFTRFVIWGLPILQIIGVLMCLLGIAWVLLRLVGVLHVLTPAEWQFLGTHRWEFMDVPSVAPTVFPLGYVIFAVVVMFDGMRRFRSGLVEHVNWLQARAEIEPRLK